MWIVANPHQFRGLYDRLKNPIVRIQALILLLSEEIYSRGDFICSIRRVFACYQFRSIIDLDFLVAIGTRTPLFFRRIP